MSGPVKPAVYLGMPRHGDPTAGASCAFHLPSRGEDLTVKVQADCLCSVATHGFNQLLADALNHRDEGRVTHFAMIHSDVEPGPMWLDTLCRVMRQEGADVVSAVIPIKEDTDGPGFRTSTAFGLLGDVWAVNRYVRASDWASMPETFGAEQCKPGEVLLVNTGLWLADLRHPAWDAFPGFGVVTDIVKTDNGPRVARFRPEDWELSRHLHSHGAKVVATWRVPVGHRGSKLWGGR